MSGEPTFGHPWHGVITHSTGKLMTNGAIEVDAVGTLPLDDETGRGRGKLMTVKVPGMPAVTTPPAAAALGWQYLNYGILSGGENRLYGKNIGARRWIYIAPDGSPWLAQFSMAFSGDVVPPGCTGNITINFYRFGQFDVPSASYVATVSGVSFPLSSAEVSLGFSGFDDVDAILYLNDISSNGSKALFSMCLMEASEFQPCQRQYYLFEVVLSGSAPSFSATATVLKRPSDMVQMSQSQSNLMQWWDYNGTTHTWTMVREDVSSNPPAPFLFDHAQMVAINQAFFRRGIFAAHYDTADALVYWTYEVAATNESTGTFSPTAGAPTFSSTATSTETDSIKILRNGTLMWSVNATSSFSSSGTEAGGSTSGTYTIGDVSGSHSFSFGAGATASGNFLFQVYGTVALTGLGLASGFQSGTRFYPFRYTNTLVGPVKLNGTGSTLLAAFGKWATDSGSVAGTHFYGAENPVTAAVVRRDSAVSVV